MAGGAPGRALGAGASATAAARQPSATELGADRARSPTGGDCGLVPRLEVERPAAGSQAGARSGASGAPGVGVGAGDAHHAGAGGARRSAGRPARDARRSPSEVGWRPPSVPSGRRRLLATAVAECAHPHPLGVQGRTEHMSALRLCRSRMWHLGGVPLVKRRASGRMPYTGFGRPCRMIQPCQLPAVHGRTENMCDTHFEQHQNAVAGRFGTHPY
jgi:hypothetical protein